MGLPSAGGERERDVVIGRLWSSSVKCEVFVRRRCSGGGKGY